MNPLEPFLLDLDRRWPSALGRVALHLIGSGALMLQTDYLRGTKDADVLEVGEVDASVRARLLELGGKGSDLQARHGVYLDVVGNGVPFLPLALRWHGQPRLDASLGRFTIRVLDIPDVLVSKLKRFSINDEADFKAMNDLGLVTHEHLVARFLSAVDRWSGDARAEDLPRCVRNLHRVERDILGVIETDVELPGWI